VRANTPKSALPTIHLGGTHPADLLRGYDRAREALQGALREIILGVEFNQRDYHLRPGHWEEATELRQEVKNALDNVLGYLDAHCEHLQEAIAAREAARKGGAQ
jgi:hypothetical protein